MKIRYGLIWLFPGDPEQAERRGIPDIPELEGPGRWACVPLRFTWSAHHSMVIDNVSDFTHAHLHRQYRPFEGAALTRCETIDDSVHVAYRSRVGRGRISGRFVEHDRIDTGRIELCYEYPYQWSDTDGAIKHWLFVLPIDERTTRVFFLFYFRSLKIPWLPFRFPRFAMKAVMKFSNRLLIGPLLDQDRFAVEAEQEGYESHWDAPPVATGTVENCSGSGSARGISPCLPVPKPTTSISRPPTTNSTPNPSTSSRFPYSGVAWSTTSLPTS